MPGTIAENPPAPNGLFGATSRQEIDVPRKQPRRKNTSPLKLFSNPAAADELGLSQPTPSCFGGAADALADFPRTQNQPN